MATVKLSNATCEETMVEHGIAARPADFCVLKLTNNESSYSDAQKNAVLIFEEDVDLLIMLLQRLKARVAED